MVLKRLTVPSSGVNDKVYGADWNALIDFVEPLAQNKGANTISDGGTIAHGLASTPTVVTITGSVAAQTSVVTARGATTFTVSIKTITGSPGSTQTIYWRASI